MIVEATRESEVRAWFRDDPLSIHAVLPLQDSRQGERADLANFAKMNEIYKRYFTEEYPARATVGTQLLGGKGIEVECIVVKG